MNAAHSRRITALEAKAAILRETHNLDCLTDAELIVLAKLPTDANGESIVPPELADEVARIMAKAEAHSG